MASGSMLDPSSAERPKSRSSLDYITEAIMERPASPAPKNRMPRKLILCFDGTGNKFHGDESDSNILKIFRMLDRTADDQFHYYQRKYAKTRAKFAPSSCCRCRCVQRHG